MDRAELIVIEPARQEDLEGILRLLDEYRLPKAGFADHLQSALVARREDVVVGCAALELYEGGALLRSVVVHQDLRSLGLGEQLVRSCLDMARSQEAARVYILTETASGYFGRFGFVPVERERVHVSVRQSLEFTEACPQDALAMVIEIPP